MVDANSKDYIWAQKYRPRKVNDCIIPEKTKAMVNGMLDLGEMSHMLFVGGPGMGKTTLAYAIANELNADVLYVNASMDSGIDTLRSKIQTFASSMSLSDSDSPKIVICDEADGSSLQFQQGAKGFLEQFSANCRFIFTANNKHKIIDPIKSRCTVVDFTIDPKDKPKIAASFFKRIIQILDTENVEYDQKAVAKLVERNFPDFRKTLNELQRFASAGKIDADILIDHSGDNIRELIKYLKEKDFKNTRQWIGRNEDIDPAILFRSIYDIATTQMNPANVPNLILILADYGYKSAFALDQQINTTAAMIEIMMQCDWQV